MITTRRGAGQAGEGVPQGSPLSPVLPLIYLAFTIFKMEERIRKAMPGLQVEINSYVDDLALTICDGDGTMSMQRMVSKGGGITREVAKPGGIPLEQGNEETIVFRRKGKKAEKVKLLGVSLDSNLRFEHHLLARVKRAKQMLRSLNSLSNSSWGLTPYC